MPGTVVGTPHVITHLAFTALQGRDNVSPIGHKRKLRHQKVHTRPEAPSW